MNAEAFVVQVRRSVVEGNVEIYRDLFENTSDAKDRHWIRALAFYKSLDSDQREVFFGIVRQAVVDSVSNVFAIIDGITELEGQDGAVRLKVGTDEISGELQDRFLELFEN